MSIKKKGEMVSVTIRVPKSASSAFDKRLEASNSLLEDKDEHLTRSDVLRHLFEEWASGKQRIMCGVDDPKD